MASEAYPKNKINAYKTLTLFRAFLVTIIVIVTSVR